MKLLVFADEGGGIPTLDSHGAFVGAAFAVASSSNLEPLPCCRSNLEWTLRLLQQIGARPACTYVRPYPGYSERLERRFDTLNAMALLTRRRTGANLPFVGADGVRTANTVWNYPISSAVLLAVKFFYYATGLCPTSMTVFFDAKSLSPESKTLIEQKTLQIGASIRGTALQMLHLGATHPMLHTMANNALSPDVISIEWEDDEAFAGTPGGMCLADSLASQVRHGLRDAPTEATLRARLDEAGFDRSVWDVTDIISQRPSGPHVEQWERDNGLVLPR